MKRINEIEQEVGRYTSELLRMIRSLVKNTNGSCCIVDSDKTEDSTYLYCSDDDGCPIEGEVTSVRLYPDGNLSFTIEDCNTGNKVELFEDEYPYAFKSPVWLCGIYENICETLGIVD